jgi:hypothetical protein
MSDDEFTRTKTGIVGKWRFYPIPTVWVEGPSDILFYEPILGDLGCRIEPFHGAENARALIDDLRQNSYPYAVILDGDYSILNSSARLHRNVVVLRKYSFENYLWEEGSINQACLRHAQCGEKEDRIGPEFERLTQHLEESLSQLVTLDVAARKVNPAPKVLPDKIELLLENNQSHYLDRNKISIIICKVEKLLNEQDLSDARKQLDLFLKKYKLVDIIKGHILFGILRNLFVNISEGIRGKRVTVNDELLTQIMAEMVWRRVPSDEHRKLKRKIRAVVRRIIELRANC